MIDTWSKYGHPGYAICHKPYIYPNVLVLLWLALAKLWTDERVWTHFDIFFCKYNISEHFEDVGRKIENKIICKGGQSIFSNPCGSWNHFRCQQYRNTPVTDYPACHTLHIGKATVLATNTISWYLDSGQEIGLWNIYHHCTYVLSWYFNNIN